MEFPLVRTFVGYYMGFSNVNIDLTSRLRTELVIELVPRNYRP